MKVKRVDIPKKRRLVDTQAESHEFPIHSVEIADNFITLFCKDSVADFWNDGTGHNPTKYHCEYEQNFWIDQQFPGKSVQGWSQHIHLNIDNPQWSDFDKYRPYMSDVLAEAIQASYED